jgi:hypothetical protein
MSQEREPHNGFEKSAAFYLEAAQTALLTSQLRLAIHLFRAAFEVESSFGPIVSSRVMEGLRKAWDIAFELGDRSMAESIFGDLAPHNSSEQNEQATLRLQTLALNQLGDMGITEDDLENIAGAISHEIMDSGSERLLDSLKSALEQLGMTDDEEENPQAIQKLPPTEAITSALKGPLKPHSSKKVSLARVGRELRELGGQNRGNEQHRRLGYQVLSGYDRALKRMRNFGFLSVDDENHRHFIEQSAAMHGVSRLSLDGTFLFFGPARDDVSLFAHATAAEIGLPVLHISVDLDTHGNGTIKFVGPFKRGFFGNPPDFMDMATPCTVLIENIDYLQEMFDNEQQAIKRNGGLPRGMMGPPGRSMQAEITGYLRALRSRPGVIIMATAEHADTLRLPLRNLLGVLHQIEIAVPEIDERRDVLISFAEEHPSFSELNVNQVARFSEGLSRHEIVSAAHAAVESAYRESLRTSQYNRVTLNDVLMQLAPFVDHESPLYQQIEDEAAAQLSFDLDQLFNSDEQNRT